ncbi:MAG TPA: ATP-binding cassette domain-containing protein [Rhodoplanes sp.]|nr:ATP-binding cassette domain-containing protein [Rhodoplanes sp.]
MRAPASELPILFEEVCVAARDMRILSDVTLALGAGAPTVLIGPNGAGKTTLLRLAMGLAAPSAGRVTWGGRDRTDGRRLGMVSQRPVMLRRSTFANVTYALATAGIAWGRRSERARQLLAQASLSNQAGRPARRLSGGEQQRLALARALARDPEVLCLDEPTASLDPANTKAVEEIVLAVAARGIKVVMATHDLGQARRLAGDVVLLVGGRIREHAPAQQFFSSPATPEAAAFVRGDLVI